MSYEQTLVKIIEPVKRTTLTRMNRGKKWKYGYNKEHDIIVISKSGTIGEVIEMQGLRIALPKVPANVYVHAKQKWQRIEYPKELSKLKNIFDWRSYPEEAKDKWYDYIDEEFKRRDEGFWFNNNDKATYITVHIICIYNGVKLTLAPQILEKLIDCFLYFGRLVKLTKDVMECVT